MPTSDLVKAREAAERLGVDIRTIHRWVAAGRLTPVIVVPGYKGALLFARADIEALARFDTEAAS